MIGDLQAPLSVQHTALIVVDMQRAFVQAIKNFDAIACQAAKLVRGANIIGVHVAATEQYPEGLGPTVPILQDQLLTTPLAKKSFTATQTPGLDLHEYDQIILCGVETHICILQTAAAYLRAGIATHVVVDAIGARSALDHELALRRIQQLGGTLTTVETVLFELLRTADCPHFKSIQELILS